MRYHVEIMGSIITDEPLTQPQAMSLMLAKLSGGKEGRLVRVSK